MLFDITIYNQLVLLVTFITCMLVLLWVFRNNFISIIDPLTLHFIWISSHISFLVAYIYLHGLSILPLFFILILALYAIVYKAFLRKNKTGIISSPVEDFQQKTGITKRIFIVLLLFNLCSKYNMFIYMIQNPNIVSWFLYRFIDMQGRNPILRILSTATQTFLLYYAFVLFAILKKWKTFVAISYLIILLLEVLTGSRSVLLNIIFNVGLCFFYFKNCFEPGTIKKFGRMAVGLSGLAMVAFVGVSAFYSSESTFIDGIGLTVNRFFAAGDGLEYYMNYNGLINIKSGLGEYIYSVFGIYIKRFTGTEYKNVGLQLSELVLGNLEFTQGPNYTLPLQVMVLGFKYFIIYVPCIAYFAARLRSIKFSTINYFPLSFYLSATSFLVVVDIEFWFLNLISGVLFFFLVLYPLSRLTLKKSS
jgi:hypothetical protein